MPSLFSSRRLVMVAADGLADHDLVAGGSDVPIKPAPRSRYATVRERLNVEAAESVLLVSPVVRARQTASRLIPGFEWTDEPFLTPRSEGRWEGKTWREVRELDPVACESYWNNLGRSRAPGGEPLAEVRVRVEHFLKGLLDQSDARTVVAVTHEEVLQVTVAFLLNAPLARVPRIEVPPLTALHLTSSWSHWHLRALTPPF